MTQLAKKPIPAKGEPIVQPEPEVLYSLKRLTQTISQLIKIDTFGDAAKVKVVAEDLHGIIRARLLLEVSKPAGDQ